MSDANETAGLPAQSSVASVRSQQDTVSPDPPAVSPAAGQPGAAVQDLGDVRLLSRFLMGVALWGGDELFDILRDLRQEIDLAPELWNDGAGDEEETLSALLRYLAIGAFVRGQKTVARGMRRGLEISLGATGWALRRVDRLTDNRLARPIRRPIGARLRRLEREADLAIAEGRIEERKARLMAVWTVNEIFEEVMDALSKNPELAELVREQIGAQSAGLTGVVVENARSVTVAGDFVAEKLVRALLRRTPRGDLPPSALAGKPQTMYSPESQDQEGKVHG